MKRKTTKSPVRIYTFGARLDPEATATAMRILRDANDYYNDLVQIENARRDAYRDARSLLCPEIGEVEAEAERLEAVLENLRRELKSARSARRDMFDDCTLRGEIEEAKRELSPINTRLRELRKQCKALPALADESQRLDALAKVLTKSLRENSRVSWTTRGRRDDAAKQAFKTSPYRVKFRRFDGTGSIGGQILKLRGIYLDTDRVFSDWSTFFQLDPLPDSQWDTRSGCRSALTAGRIRVGSQGAAPVWLPFTVKIHRRLPKGIIKNAWLLITKCGERTKVQLQMTIESESFTAPSPSLPPVAVALGWERSQSGGSHVATVASADGSVRHLVLPHAVHSAIDHAESIRSAADRYFDEARERLAVARDAGELPDEVADQCATIRNWRGARRLRRIERILNTDRDTDAMWQRWKTDRLAAGHDLYAPPSEVESLEDYLHIWARKDRHLRQVEADLRRKATARRLDIYRNFVASLAGHEVLLDELDLKAFVREKNPEDEHIPRNVQRLRAQCAPAKLGELLEASGAVKVRLKPGDGETATPLGGTLRLVQHCVRVLRVGGHDTSALEATLNEQRRTLDSLRQMAAE